MKTYNIKYAFLLLALIFSSTKAHAQTQLTLEEVSIISQQVDGTVIDDTGIITHAPVQSAPGVIIPTDTLNYEPSGRSLFQVSYSPPTDTAYLTFWLDINGDGSFNNNEELLEEFTSTTGIFSDTLMLPATFNEVSMLRLGLSDLKKDTIPPISHLFITNNGCPPIIVTSTKQDRDLFWIRCIPLSNYVTIFMRNNDNDYQYELIDFQIDDQIVPIIANQTILPSDNLTYEFVVDLSPFSPHVGWSGVMQATFESNGNRSYRTLPFTMGCCFRRDATYTEEDRLPFFTSTQDFIFIDANNAQTDSINLEEEKSVYLQAANYIEILPGIEILPDPSYTFKAYIAECAEAPNSPRMANNNTEEKPIDSRQRLLKDNNNFKFQLYPNPFDELVNIEFSLEKKSTIDLSIYSLLGQKIKTAIHTEHFERGDHQLNIDTAQLPKGTYIYQLRINNKSYFKKMIKL